MSALALTATQRILDALRPDQTPHAWMSACSRAGLDWDDLAVRAIAFGLAPQLYRRLVEWELALPSRTTAKLAVTYQAHAQRNAAIYAQLGEILTACATRGLYPIALKGVHLAAVFYPEPALRPMNDIDLLFTPEELPAAEAVLEDLGYAGKRKSPDLGPGVTKHTSTFRRGSAVPVPPNPYLATQADRTVEPHTSLEESWFGLRVDITPGVRERPVMTTLGGHPCRVLAPEDLLLHVSVHFTFHLIMGAPALVQLTDLLVIAQAGAVDWPTFVARAMARHAAPYVLAAFTLAQNLLNAPVPPGVMADLEQATPARLRQRIERLDLSYVLRRTQQKPLTTISQRIRRGLSDRAETARWAPDWAGRWRVWKTALNVPRTDTGRMLLGRG